LFGPAADPQYNRAASAGHDGLARTTGWNGRFHHSSAFAMTYLSFPERSIFRGARNRRAYHGSGAPFSAHARVRISVAALAIAVAIALPPAHAADPAARPVSAPHAADPAKIEFFEKRIRPLLADNCFNCHSADTNSKGGLRVDDRNGLVVGGRGGPAVVPGKPQESLLLRAVSYADKNLQMPPKKRLTPEQIADLERWIRDGAAWPAVELPSDLGSSEAEYEKLRESHWAFQSIRASEVPQVDDAAWPRDDVDRFLLAELERRKLEPVGDAPAEALIRRLTFDLTGLPPTVEEIERFVADRSTLAVERLVDRLLASPHFGERWGRHWLDVARYAESSGPSRNMPYPHAWRYRDYVIDSFNADKPFDRFLREQIAGDLLAADLQTGDLSAAAGSARRDELHIATGFLALGAKDVNQRFKVRFMMDNVDEQIDTVSRALLGLTASCARCHDHKFDPIPTTDYYALAGIFQSTDLCGGVRNLMGGGGLDYYDTDRLIRLGDVTVTTADEQAEIEVKKAELVQARKELVALRDDPENKLAQGEAGEKNLQAAKKRIDEIQQALVRMTDPAQLGPVALGAREGKKPADTELRVRGEAEKLGPTIPRGFLTALAYPGAPQINPAESGRRELAEWLASPKNPLTARVFVNRVWHHLFGQGLVRSVDNFGVTGDAPSHPELLDHLASRFMRDGWSVKRLVRTLVLTRAYRLSAEGSPDQAAADPDNRYLWRHAPRRLTAEEIRDAMLAAAGRLELDRPPGSPAAQLPVVELRDTAADAKRLLQYSVDARHRSVYLPLLRGLTPPSLEVFDFAQQSLVTGSRDQTTVAPQALYLLNDSFVRRQALALAAAVPGADSRDDAGRLGAVYRRVLGRAPSQGEIARAVRFLGEYETLARRLAPPPAAVADASTSVDSESTDPEAVAGAKAVAGQAVVEQNPDKVARDSVARADVASAAADPLDPRLAAWSALCQALFASAEFRYLK
jgi:cytochrome c553